jgi:hypothetical protein
VQDRPLPHSQGRTRWRRFAAVTVPAVLAIGAILFAVANGAIAASFALSGTTFKIGADKLVGTGFVQYVDLRGEDEPSAVAVAGIGEATITGMCQSLVIPGLGVSVILRAGRDPQHPAQATNLTFDMSNMSGDAGFGAIKLGQDAGSLTKAGPDAHGVAGSFGEESDSVTLAGVHQVAFAASAGTFTLPGLHLQLSFSGEECFR